MKVTVKSVSETLISKNNVRFRKLTVSDETGEIEAVSFCFVPDFVKINSRVYVAGEISEFRNNRSVTTTEWIAELP